METVRLVIDNWGDGRRETLLLIGRQWGDSLREGRLQILDKLREPSLGGGILDETCGERAVLQLIGQALSESLASSWIVR